MFGTRKCTDPPKLLRYVLGPFCFLWAGLKNRRREFHHIIITGE